MDTVCRATGAKLLTPAYTESAAAGASPFALAYDAQTATGVRGEIGTWTDAAFTDAGGTEFRLIGRIGWAPIGRPIPSYSATFLGIPDASFVVNGAAPPADLLLLSIGAGWRWISGWSFLAKFDSELSGSSQSYAEPRDCAMRGKCSPTFLQFVARLGRSR